MEADKKKKIAVAGILGGIGLLFLLLKRGHAKPPPPPPGKATLYGKVTDAETGQPIEAIEVTFNEYAAVSDQSGYYAINNIEPGIYSITFTDPQGRYETAEV